MTDKDALYRAILQAATDGFLMVDMQGRLLEVNEAYCRMSGYTEQELLALSIADLDVGESEADATAHNTRIAARGWDRFEARHRRKDGTEFDVEVTARRVPGDDLRLVGFVRDVTDTRRGDHELRDANAMFSQFVRRSPIYTFIKEVSPTRSVVLYASDNYIDMLGIDACAMVGRTMEQLFPPEFAAHMTADDWAVASNGVVFKQDETLNGRTYTTIKFPLALGEKTLLAGYTIDITDHLRGEADRAALEAQLQQAQKMESVGRLAGGVAHDFNNMLGVIIGQAEMALEDTSPSHSVHQCLLEIRGAARRSADLTRQLLTFARKQTAVPKVLDLNQTVSESLTMLRRLIGEDIRLDWRPKAELWLTQVDPSHLDQILSNLCVNASDAITGVGTLTIATSNEAFVEADCLEQPGLRPGEWVRLLVCDDGCGMDEQTLGHVFEPFFTTKGIGRGTGLGLASVYGAVSQHGGFITVQSRPGAGTTMAVHLPRHRGQLGVESVRDETRVGLGGHETILLVEDEGLLLNLTAAALQRFGYTVLSANNPIEAIRMANQHAVAIDLLLTDVVMPDMNGRELANQLLLSRPHLKCLFVSGYTAEVIANRGILDTSVHFLQKPFSIDALAVGVRKALEQP
jgi:PAS domain S-box-containing protein